MTRDTSNGGSRNPGAHRDHQSHFQNKAPPWADLALTDALNRGLRNHEGKAFTSENTSHTDPRHSADLTIFNDGSKVPCPPDTTLLSHALLAESRDSEQRHPSSNHAKRMPGSLPLPGLHASHLTDPQLRWLSGRVPGRSAAVFATRLTIL